uniref:Biotin carboxylase n=1 Tax=Candidatus Kentrum sp. FM TaxID=2126340 RepID=A0A450SUG2_9GAMM|nr:MAG: urea carboxylase [Candidatus Kentron sp. FM]VFJ64463.1 MAG: urea carboxylase [Candidatus Kentron sp. FM]VFK15172.1 MAG: urea carboxylase [Candidatus Kentron sp. FM]
MSFNKPYTKILVANRGEIACRIFRTCARMGIETVAIYSEADKDALHVRLADEAVFIGSSEAKNSYLNIPVLLEAALQTKAEAIHPGYGFLSESARFACECKKRGIDFVGPFTEHINLFGRKDKARRVAREIGIPVITGSPAVSSKEEALLAAENIGYPVMIKETAGGGGIGMHTCRNRDDISLKFPDAKSKGAHFFGDSSTYLEKCVENVRHIEVQIFGDGKGNISVLGDRECSIQRHYQKIVEEAPSPSLDEDLRARLFAAARRLGEKIVYQSAGTVEFLVDKTTGDFYFLEVNTRIQVEHAVTEAVTGLDIVALMLRTSAGESIELKETYESRGHAIEARVYAEDPARDFAPSPGTLTEVHFPDLPWARYDSGVQPGSNVPGYYDPIIAKVVVHGSNRDEAVSRLAQTLEQCRLGGTVTNLEYLRRIASNPEYANNEVDTHFTRRLSYVPNRIEVLEAGFYSTVQSYPGRIGYWNIGVPPSGPMDGLAFRIANRLVGNADRCSGFEFTLGGPTLQFSKDTAIALTGARMEASLDGSPVEWWTAIRVRAGSTLELGNIIGGGYRTYLSVGGGLALSDYLGSQATFVPGSMGGVQGGVLQVGQLLPVAPLPGEGDRQGSDGYGLPSSLCPDYGDEWEIGVLYGPHGAPDFFQEEDIAMFFSQGWKVHHNSNRLGIRLSGPKPKWARKDGGEAGLHPSNIHDCVYAIGSVNFTGDMPIILAQDGPSLGGFVCPVTIAQAELWKIGQLKPNDTIHFKRISYEEAIRLEKEQNSFLDAISHRRLEANTGKPIVNTRFSGIPGKSRHNDAIVLAIPASEAGPSVTCRMAGDNCVLVEYGPMVLDLNMRIKVHLLTEFLEKRAVDGILELSPGVRSLQIRYDSLRLDLSELLDILAEAEKQASDPHEAVIASRTVRLPLAFDDRWNKAAVEKYTKSVRPTAPYLPSNIDFIARINGLDDADRVRDIVMSAEYLVLGLGDVYLGAPCAVPLDPRHRLVTSKYNPARLYTPEGSVGIGGVYLCIYGMDSPGGYQLVGRTLPIWDKFVVNPNSREDKPWLLRFFDRVRFYPVSDDELETLRDQYSGGRLPIQITEGKFSLHEYNRFLHSIAEETARFKQRQQGAFARELAHWEREGMIGATEDQNDFVAGFDSVAAQKNREIRIPAGCKVIRSKSGGQIVSLLVQPGDRIKKGQPVAIVEAMKTEIRIDSDRAGTVTEIPVATGMLIDRGNIILVLEPNFRNT